MKEKHIQGNESKGIFYQGWRSLLAGRSASIEEITSEELACAMEMVETQNQNPTTMGVRYNNPGCLKFAKWEREYGAVQMANRFAKFPDVQLGQASAASLTPIGNMTGRMVPYYRPEMTRDKLSVPHASSSPEIEKVTYVVRVCGTLNIPKRKLSRHCYKGLLYQPKTHVLEKILISAGDCLSKAAGFFMELRTRV